MWDPPIGATDNPCDFDSYRGPSPGSESEIRSLVKFLSEHNDTLKGYINVHAHSGMWFYPWGYAKHTYPEDIEDLVNFRFKKA